MESLDRIFSLFYLGRGSIQELMKLLLSSESAKTFKRRESRDCWSEAGLRKGPELRTL